MIVRAATTNASQGWRIAAADRNRRLLFPGGALPRQRIPSNYRLTGPPAVRRLFLGRVRGRGLALGQRGLSDLSLDPITVGAGAVSLAKGIKSIFGGGSKEPRVKSSDLVRRASEIRASRGLRPPYVGEDWIRRTLEAVGWGPDHTQSQADAQKGLDWLTSGTHFQRDIAEQERQRQAPETQPSIVPTILPSRGEPIYLPEPRQRVEQVYRGEPEIPRMVQEAGILPTAGLPPWLLPVGIAVVAAMLFLRK